MDFRENWEQKIKIDDLTRKIQQTLGRPAPVRIDKDAMRQLLDMGAFKYHQTRDLDLYIIEEDQTPPLILVLDNELPLYRTTPEDVAMRKSPTLKEMVNIRNAIKILNDGDVVVSKKGKSLEDIRQRLVARLDLGYTPDDIETLKYEGVAALDSGDADEVLACLRLFQELLDFTPLPSQFAIDRCRIFGRVIKTDTLRVGPVIIYNKAINTLLLIDRQMRATDQDSVDCVNRIAFGREKPDHEGDGVFEWLKHQVSQKPAAKT